jgi:hypothetical protein
MAGRIEPCKFVLTKPLRDVAFYVAADGTCQVESYLQMPGHEKLLARFFWLAEQLANTGRIANQTQFRHESAGIWGLKLPDQERVACFQDGRIWVCAHAFHKNGKWMKADFERANAIREDYFRRKAQR